MVPSNTADLSTPVSDRDHSRGREEAPVTLIEYGDYECPYCGEAARAVELVRERMGSDLRFVFRNFPLVESHPHAMQAAEAAEAAASAGKFWEMHDTLYAHQRRLREEDLEQYAGSLGIDTDQFERDLTARTTRARIEEDLQSGEESGVQGTPWFFINGARYEGSWDPDELLSALRAAMPSS